MTTHVRGQIGIVAHGMLGYGFPEASLEAAVDRGIDLIAVDAGSTDPGPFYLGSGKSFCNLQMVERDLDLLVEAQLKSGAKMVIGSAGGAGSDVHLDQTYDLLDKAIRRTGRSLKVARISSEMGKDELRTALREGKISPFETMVQLTEDDIESSEHVVAQIGTEPIIAALKEGPDIVICGRSWDPGNIAAMPIALGFDPGLSIHAGKILECGAQAALPVEGSDLLLGFVRQNDFLVEPCAGNKRCTVDSVAAHTLYEKTDPVLLPGPGGRSDLRKSEFRQHDERTVSVSGSRFIRDPIYRIKLEGAKFSGWRNLVIAGIRDPKMIEHLNSIQSGLVDRVASFIKGRVNSSEYRIVFHRYGIDGVMQALEPVRALPHEVGLVIEVVGTTEAVAGMVAGAARSLLLHWTYPGRVATAGNLALPFSPAEIPAGPVYEFSIYHLMEMPDPISRFNYRMEHLG
jgi:Acyclic terpene utilisation family protein AtuA